MIVKVSFEMLTETRANDEFLCEALERMVTEQFSESDLRLVTQTFKARMGPSHVQVQEVTLDKQMKQGDLRVWWVRNAPGKFQYWSVGSTEEAAEKLIELERADLADETVVWNAGGLEVCEPGENGLEWATWYGGDGEDVDDLVDELRVRKES